mgnify:CR=1 FL=1
MFTNNEANLWENSIEYMHDAVYYYSLWNGDYPYKHCSAVDGTISATTYELASTFIYDGNQESLPFKYANTHTIASGNDLCALSLNVSAKGPYDPRISGGRIYIRELGTDSEYIMLLDIDLTKGCRTKFSDDYTVWHDAGSSQYNCPTATATANFEVTEFGLLTYEIINGFSSSIFSLVLAEEITDSGIPANGPGNHNVYACRMYGANLDAEL